MVGFMLKDNSSKTLNYQIFCISELIIILNFNFSGPLHISSYSWNRQTSLPKSLSLISQWCDNWINDYTLWERSQFSISWIILRNLNDANVQRNTDLRCSYTKSFSRNHRVLKVLDDVLYLLRRYVFRFYFLCNFPQDGVSHSGYWSNWHCMLCKNIFIICKNKLKMGIRQVDNVFKLRTVKKMLYIILK